MSKFGLIFAGAQKNVGPAGMTIVIMREDLLGFAGDTVPTYLDYKTHAENDSMYNTPPCFAIYIAGEVFKNIKNMGGVGALNKVNVEKAGKLYDYIDASDFYQMCIRDRYIEVSVRLGKGFKNRNKYIDDDSQHQSDIIGSAGYIVNTADLYDRINSFFLAQWKLLFFL